MSKAWIKLLIIWLAAWPAAVLTNLLNQSFHGLPHILLGLLAYALIVYALGGWIPPLVTFSTNKK
jgi:ABC-type phosphate transport system permease subunit